MKVSKKTKQIFQLKERVLLNLIGLKQNISIKMIVWIFDISETSVVTYFNQTLNDLNGVDKKIK